MTTASTGAKTFSKEDLLRRAIERRAVQAVIWGMPPASVRRSYRTRPRYFGIGISTRDQLPSLLDDAMPLAGEEPRYAALRELLAAAQKDPQLKAAMISGPVRPLGRGTRARRGSRARDPLV